MPDSAGPNLFDTTGSGGVWFHAVSVGEVLSAVELVRRLRVLQPELPIHVSTSTLAAHALAQHRLAGMVQGVFFAPLDYRSVVRRVLRALRPASVVILETEIWPNLYREAKRSGASLLVVNGRISDRALPRYLTWKNFFRYALLWPDAILTQSEEDRRRYISAGAPAEKVRAAGNLKYDFTPPATVAPALVEFLDRAKPPAIWIAASTMPPAESGDPDEDDAVIAAFLELAQKHSGLLLILTPRRPERFATAAEKLARAGVSFVRRSELDPRSELALPGVLLVDSIGELAALFERADAVFMGGTLARRGGHNILEPAYFAKPVIVGPHMENFAEIAREFTAAQAVVNIAGPQALAGAVKGLLADPARGAGIGVKAQALALSRRGVVDRIAQHVLDAVSEGIPNPPRTLLARVFLTPLSWAWGAGHRINLARGLAAQKALDTPVISVGGLTMGGSGKSPMVARLAELLSSGLAADLAGAGRNPAILTRGYRRESAHSTVVVPRGENAPIERTGDEAQMFVRAGIAHVGIGSDRFETGRRMETQLHPGVFLLDDGFQHVRLKRDCDIVLIDATDPHAGGLFPLGRRREPLENLARATAIVLTRTVAGRSYAGVEKLVRRYNPKAPIFRSRVTPHHWMEADWGTPRPARDPGFRRVAAFCGLGSPRWFFHTVRELGLDIVFQWTFADHHRYRPHELRRLARQAEARGAEALITTEKDLMNLGVHRAAPALIAPLPTVLA